MIIEMRMVGDVRVLDCSGKITLGEGTLSVRKVVRNALESGTKKIILNLQEVSYVDSSGLGELMRVYSSVSSAGGQVRLLHVNQRIRELLSMSKLSSYFEIFEDEKSALASFGQPLVRSAESRRG